MKTKSSIKNSIASIIQYVVVLLVGFVSQKMFINILGIDYLGLNGLFSNIVGMLGIVELGVGSAIIYNLYKPIVNNDTKTVNALMKFYKKSYYVIAIAILIIGLSIIPFLNFIIKDINIDINIILVYVLFILEIVSSYILSYKRSILYADQKNYIINIIHIIYYILLNVVQLIYLYLTKNYYGYLIIKIIFRFLENLVITIYVNKNYNYLNDKKANKLDDAILKDIKTKVNSLFLHKIGSFVVLGTDNIIISKYLGLSTVGLYSNYYLIIDSINKLFSQAITAVIPSIGHLLIEGNKEKNYVTFKRLRFINFWIATFASVGILIVIKPFITIWLGTNYLLDDITLLVLVFNFYQKMMRSSFSSFKEAAGIYYEDRFIPILESLSNIVFSILLVKLVGLPGVFLGTIISGLWLWCYSYPKYVYKKLFDRTYIDYALETLGYISVFLIIGCLSLIISNLSLVNSIWLSIFINIFIALVIPNLIIMVLYKQNDNYIYLKKLFINIFKKCIGRE